MSDRKTNRLSKAPSAPETLAHTISEWRLTRGGADKAVNLQNESVCYGLAKALFSDSYNLFEIFLDDSGVDDDTKDTIKKKVFEKLVDEKAMGGSLQLAAVIAGALHENFSTQRLAELILAMEKTYQKQVIESLPDGIPVQVTKVDRIDKLPQLILGILDAGDLY